MNQRTLAPSTSRPRAYLLLEAAIGGAMVAVILGSILTSLSQARTMSIVLGRDQVASTLVVEKIDELRALGFAGNPVAVTTENPVAAIEGKYKRTVTVTACTETIPAPGANVNCRDIVVAVEFNVSKNAKVGAATTRVSTGQTRVYQ